MSWNISTGGLYDRREEITKMLTDIQIAQNAKMEHIGKIAEKLGLTENDIDYYGKYKAKISLDVLDNLKNKKDGKLILVTAINPTPAGEGKTTTTVGLGQAMSKIGKNAVIALREPSLGPVMGVKGGAAGGGYAQVVLTFTLQEICTQSLQQTIFLLQCLIPI